MEIDNPNTTSYLFTVDILIEEPNNAAALQTLLSMLNSPKCKDFKVLKGIELGQTIDDAMQNKAISKKELPKSSLPATPAAETKKMPPSKSAEAKNDTKDIANLIDFFKNNNTLIRLSVLKGKGVKLSIPCRIVNLDSGTQMVTVYHVDEKKVYQFSLNEIDDFAVN